MLTVQLDICRMKSTLKTPLGRFHVLAFAEGASLILILLVTMPLKYLLNIPEPNSVVGMLHGLLFIVYVIAVVWLTVKYSWSFKTLFLGLLASIVPFGTFYFTARVLPKERKEGTY